MKDGAYDEFNEEDLERTFSKMIQDYKKMVKISYEEGLDVDEDPKDFKNEFKNSSLDEKEEIIDRVKDRITSLVEVCDTVPEEIEEKYSREKDLVALMNKF